MTPFLPGIQVEPLMLSVAVAFTLAKALANHPVTDAGGRSRGGCSEHAF